MHEPLQPDGRRRAGEQGRRHGVVSVGRIAGSVANLHPGYPNNWKNVFRPIHSQISSPSNLFTAEDASNRPPAFDAHAGEHCGAVIGLK